MFDLLGRPKRVSLFAASTIALVASISSAHAQEQARAFNIPAQPLSSALIVFARQSEQMVLADPAMVRDRRAPAVQGNLTPTEALTRLLAGTGLSATPDANGSFVLADTSSPTRLGAADQASSSTEGQAGVADILVIGRRTLNADIRRYEDDAQPYVVFSGDDVLNSGAHDIVEFLRNQLPMNAAQGAPAQNTALNNTNAQGTINLRGLGADQTLVLVDGRRLPNVSTGGEIGQPNISGIPTSAIERIEILPATASGAYGGGATGGVINIILKRDYSGFDIQASHGAAFQGDAANDALSLTGGFRLEDGRTQVMVTASHSEQDPLFGLSRSFARSAGELYHANNPGDIFSAIGSTGYIFSPFGETLVLDPAFGGASLNSSHTFVPNNYLGPASDTAGGLLSNAGGFSTDSPAAVLYAAPTIDAFGVNVRRRFTDHIDGYLDLYHDHSETDLSTPLILTLDIAGGAAANPFQQDVRVVLPVPNLSVTSRSETTNTRASAGAIVRLPHSWSSAFDYGWSRTSIDTETRSFSSPTPSGLSVVESAAFSDLGAAPIADPASLLYPTVAAFGPADDTLQTISLRASGPVLDIPGGEVVATLLLEARHEELDAISSVSAFDPFPPSYGRFPPGEQDVTSQYIELRAPIFSSQNAIPLVRELELTAAARHDAYSTRFAGTAQFASAPEGPFSDPTYVENSPSSTDYTLALRYSPLQDIVLRASFGTGFLPPRLSALVGSTFPFPAFALAGVTDPARGGVTLTGDPDGFPPGFLSLSFGGNANVRPETSESFSYGVVVTPSFIENLRVSFDVTRISKRDEITSPDFQFLLDNESLLPDRITRGPSQPGDQPGWLGPVIAIDATGLNLAKTDVEALDIQADYSLSTTRFGDWRFYAVATHQNRFERRAAPNSETVSSLGYSDGPLEWRGNFGAVWNSGPWNVSWNAQYYDDYRVYPSTAAPFVVDLLVQNQGAPNIPSQIYQDVSIRYAFERDGSSLLANTELMLGVQNLFDEDPPLLADATGSAPYSAYGDPRLRRFTITLRKHFGD